MTDLHKGTHNCAAAIRESGAGISSPSLTPPTPAFLHPRGGSQPPQSTLSHPRRGFKGDWRERQKHGHSVSTLLSFFHTSGRRRRWFLGGTTLLLPSCSHSSFALLPLSSFPLSPFLSSCFSSTWTFLTAPPSSRASDVTLCLSMVSYGKSRKKDQGVTWRIHRAK